MARLEITNFYIYRWRYILGYGVVGLALAALLVFAGLYVPGGISAAEMTSVVKSDTLSITSLSSLATTNLPYYLLQGLSLHLFGVHDFSIKLPSLILGLLSAIGMVLLLRRWFKPNIAILASLIAITTGQFLFVAQNGTPGILYIFWPVVLLLLGTLITRTEKRRFIWKALFFIAAALSFYTPLIIYPLGAMTLAVILHPHLRNVVRRISKPKLIGAAIIALIIMTPLIWGIVKNPQLGLSLLGFPTELPDILANIKLIFHQYLDFWKPSTTTLMTPVFGLGSILLILYGLYRMIQTRETTQSYLIIIWLICLVPVLIINPSFTSITFIPLVLLLTTGLSSLIAYWYNIFPRNPYARIAGLIPLIVLVVGLVGSGLDRYVYGYHYDPHTTVNFSKDLTLLPKNTAQLIVLDDQLAFYKVLERHSTGLTVLSEPSAATTEFTATRTAKRVFPGFQIQKIITTVNTQDADRFYIYKKTTP
jgi:4-amino-4-deoxy-L-arabinose transferase-like glycosyltransferase